MLFVAEINLGFDWATTSLLIGAFAPAFVLLGAISFDRFRRAKIVKPPQEEKLLRPPGYSLAVQFDSLMERSTLQLVGAMFWTALAGVIGGFVARLLVQEVGFLGMLLPIIALTGAILAGTALAIRAYRTLQEGRNVRLGLRGEQATAEALAEASDAGFRVFHDIQGGDDWNIDHVAIGPKGVFLMETKARSRIAAKGDQPEHHVKFDGTTLAFPMGIDRDAVAQARRNAGWLANFLTKKTGESVAVDAIVVLPGWWVEGRGEVVKAMNCKYLTKYLRSQKDKMTPEQVTRITTALDEKNRTLDFI